MGTCESVLKTASTEVNVTGLDSGTSYTFKAYSDSSCGTELASGDFTTQKVTTLMATGTTTDSLKLTISDHSGNWYYNYTTPTGGNCSSAGSGSSTTVSGLAANTTYTFTAYSNSVCTTELATAASFTTPPGIPPRLYLEERPELIRIWWQAPAGATTARLQRSQTNGNWDSAVSGEIGAGSGVAQSLGL